MRGWLGLALLGSLLVPAPGWGQGEGTPENPRRRWEWFHEQRAYPFGRIPPGALQRAREQLAALTSSPWAAPPEIVGTSWRPIGPERIPISLTSTGRVSSIEVDPSDSNTLYIGGAQGGVWKSTDLGASWTPLTDGECSLAMGSIAIDPLNPAVVYAGTGEQHFSADSYYGCGILRSQDGGATWTQLGRSVFVRVGSASARIARVLLDPSTVASGVTGTTVYAASDFGLFRSPDGGASWSLALSGIATDLVLDPANPSTLYAGVRREGVYRSLDRGATWTKLATGLPADSTGRINLALAPSAPLTLFAAVHNTVTGGFLGLWKTTDGGTAWTRVPAQGLSCGTQCWYDLFVAVHPTDPARVFFGGVNLYRSVDGGLTFTNIRGSIHVDQHDWAFDPRDPEVVYVANDGGVYRSGDGGTSWASLNTNLALTQFYPGISLHPWDPTHAMGGTQDNGTVQFAGSAAWLSLLGGDGGYTAIDPSNPFVRYAETQWTTGSTYAGPRRSDGGSFERKVNGIDTGEPALFIPPLVMDPVNASVLYFGTERLYRTADRAESWTPIGLEVDGAISCIAPAVSESGTIYVGTNRGKVWVTQNGGQSWREAVSGLPNRYVKSLAVDPTDARRVFLAVSGFGSGHVYRTGNGGDSWENVSGSLPDVPVNAVILDPARPTTVFIGTDLGVFLSPDGGASWSPHNGGLPNVAVFDLAYNAGTGVLLAATHGRGMYSLTLERPLTLAVVPPQRSGSAVSRSQKVGADSAMVVMSGPGALTAGWTASQGGSNWLILTSAQGTGTARIGWKADPSALEPGLYRDTIRVSAAGAHGSPFEVVYSLAVSEPVRLSVAPATRVDTTQVGSRTPRPDSASVTLSGPGSELLEWQAWHKGSWLNLTTASQKGSGTLRWTRDPSGLGAGVHVDTLWVTAPDALGAPAPVVDMLVVVDRPLGLDPGRRGASAVAGSLALLADSARVLVGGAGADTVHWTASVGAGAWLALVEASGTGSGTLRYTRNPAGLGAGSREGSILVVASTGEAATLFDTFRLTAPVISVQCAGSHLLSNACLTEVDQRFLDLEGNRDGVYNLGDYLAHRARQAQGKSPGGGP